MDKHTSPHDVLKKDIIFLDGATGTNLQDAGLPSGLCPEEWLLENPDVLRQLQTDFYQAGSDIVCTFTFGANAVKLKQHGLDLSADEVSAMNKDLAAISLNLKEQVQAEWPERNLYVAGDLAPTGLFLKPAGDLNFEELIEIYQQQVAGLLTAGVDLFIVETMMDLAQARAAVFAIHSLSDLPVFVSFTVEENGRTLSGNPLETCLLTLAPLGVQAVGLNCSSGPTTMAKHMDTLFSYAGCRLMAKPNAGLPRLTEDGRSVFDLGHAEFAQQMMSFGNVGVNILGGCCGTTAGHMKALTGKIHEYKLKENFIELPRVSQRLTSEAEKHAYVCSGRKISSLQNRNEWPLLIYKDPDDLIDDIFDCMDDEPDGLILDFSKSADETINQIGDLLAEIQMATELPLIFKLDQAALQKAIVKNYHGLTAFISNNVTKDLPAYILS